jgi:anti-sigma regulatory factor (Ser/Thr protein kinase)
MTLAQSHRVEPIFSTFAIKNNRDELAKLSAWINEFAGDVGLSAESAFQLELALSEAATNVIEHAFEDEVEHTLTIKLEYHQNQFTIELIDDGQPFDLTQYPAIEFPRTLAEAGEGGLGIHLIRHYTDEIHYQRQNNQNIITMIITTHSSNDC